MIKSFTTNHTLCDISLEIIKTSTSFYDVEFNRFEGVGTSKGMNSMSESLTLKHLVKAGNTTEHSYGTFSTNSSTSQERRASSSDEDIEAAKKKDAENQNCETALDRCWKHCQRALTYLSAAPVERNYGLLEFEKDNR